MDQKLIIQQILDIGKRMWQKGFVAANDGNISVKINDNEFLTTATGVSKGFMTSEMVIRVNNKGEVLDKEATYKPSSELKMHLKVYKKRPDISAVVHAHPPYTTVFAVQGKPLDKFILPEAIILLGVVPVAKYATPSTPEVPDSISPFLSKSDAIILQNHGALTMGMNLETAYFRMETLEHYAKILYLSQSLNDINIISGKELDKLKEIRQNLTIPGRVSFE